MENLYPPGPAAMPEDLTAPGPAYKRQAKVAFLSLMLFIALYLSLTAWFGWTAYNYFVNANDYEKGPLIAYGLSAASAFLSVFLAKGLFFVNHGGEVNDLEVTPDEEPRLFEFLYKLADEAGAPRPHRVFLSGRVNAAVFYDLTLLNLIFPSKKNLEIGLALVNGLNLGEFKAVLAHEFGHFRQGSMAVGRWVYVAQQIATHIIYQRDILDRFLSGLSSIDIRIAWIGWLLRLIVWALRAILDTVFSLVVLAQRSLSREMEFHADMVSVSLTGSDALIHALHRLGAADEAWDRALGFAGQELAAGRAVTDIFVAQTVVTERMKEIVDDDYYATPPPLPMAGRERHRIFDAEDAQPPRMWSTHPPNCDREENAKKTYIAANIDERSAWEVFANPQALRERMTEHLLRQPPDAPALSKSPVTESVSLLTQQYTKKVFDRRYRGSYMGRSVVREFAKAEEAIGAAESSVPLAQQFDDLYPDDLSHKFEHWRGLEQEKETLRALRDGLLEPPDGVIRHRGVILKRREIPQAIEELRSECDEARRDLCEHDRKVRGVHNIAAANFGSGWQAYHTGLVQLLHYADHSSANLADVQGRLNNLWSVITADGKISSGEIKQLLTVSEDMYSVLQSIDATAADVRLSSDIAEKLGMQSWRAALSEEFGLAAPTRQNIGEWLEAAQSWVQYFQNALGILQAEALDTLLDAEARIERCVKDNSDPGEPPLAGGISVDYPVLLPNSERKLQRRLGLWDRFQTATGFFPALTRFAVAVTIVGGLLGAGIYTSSSAHVVVFNGLATPVVVSGLDAPVVVPAMSKADLTAQASSDLAIETHTQDGMLVEALEVDASSAFATYVYNVAQAMPLIEWEANYGNRNAKDPEYLGAVSWTTAHVDYLFEEPPESINTSGEGGIRSVLSEFRDLDPRYLDDYFPKGADTAATIVSHALWDHANSLYMPMWLSLAANYADLDAILATRLARNPNEVMALRFEQDYAESEAEHTAVCERHAARAQAAPDNTDWQYLAARCASRADRLSTLFIDLQAVAPDNPWITAAAAYEYAGIGQWAEAVAGWEAAYQQNVAMRISYSSEIARGRRMLQGTDAGFTDLAGVSPWLKFQASLQSGEPQSNPLLVAYQQILNGDLEPAFDYAKNNDGAELLRMIAASDGATDEMIDLALAMDPGDGISADSIWVAIGLAIRHGKPTDELFAQSEESLGDYAQVARAFFDGLADTRAAEASLQGVSQLRFTGAAYAGGVVALGEQAPAAWRENARRLLFITERPYFE